MKVRKRRRSRRQSRTIAVIKRSGPRKKRISFIGHLGKIFLSPPAPRSRRAGKLYFITGGILVFFLSIGYFLFFTEQFLITNINIEANKNTEQNIHEYLDKIFDSKKFFILRQNKTINFPTENFKKNIFFEIPKIKKVEVQIQVPSTLNIKVEERKQEGIWCVYGNLESIPECFFYDKEGIIYEEAPNSVRGSLIKNIRDGRVEVAQLGSAVMNTQLLEYINNLINALELAYEHPNYIFIKNNDEIRAGFSKGLPAASSAAQVGWEAYFSRSQDLIESVENLILILEKEIGVRVSELLYIDLRLGNKAFYKYSE